MNRRSPRERHNERMEGMKIWDYTNEDDQDKIYPIGYCCAWVDYTDAQLKELFPDLPAAFKQDYEERKIHKDKYHTTGHKSAQEAANCYKQYLIDNEITLGDFEPTAPCDQCGKETKKLLYVSHWPTFRLCEEHPIGPFLEKKLVITTAIYQLPV